MTAWRYEISLLVLKKYSKRNFLSPRGHVISSIYAYSTNNYTAYNTYSTYTTYNSNNVYNTHST